MSGGIEGRFARLFKGREVTPTPTMEIPVIDEAPETLEPATEVEPQRAETESAPETAPYTDSKDLEKFDSLVAGLEQELAAQGISTEDIDKARSVLEAAIKLQKEAEAEKGKKALTSQLEDYAHNLEASANGDEELLQLAKSIMARVDSIRQENA